MACLPNTNLVSEFVPLVIPSSGASEETVFRILRQHPLDPKGRGSLLQFQGSKQMKVSKRWPWLRPSKSL
jgi:hypothetical protein